MRRPPLLPTLACVCLLACTGKDDESASSEGADASPSEPAAPEPPKQPKPGDIVVLDTDAPIYAAPDATPFELSPSSSFGHTFEVRGVEGEFVALRTLELEPEQGPPCTGVLDVEEDYQLDVYARLEHLAPVLVEPLAVEFDDGAKLEFAAGVPVMGEGEEVTLAVGGASFSVDMATMARAKVGRWYAAPEPAPVFRTFVEYSSALRYGEHVISAVGLYDTPGHAIAAKPVEGGQLVTFAGACGTFTLFDPAQPEDEAIREGLYAMKGPKDAVPQMAKNFDPDMAARNAGILGVMQQEGGHFLASPYGGAFAVGEDCQDERWQIEADTKLSWKSGGEAGIARTKHDLPSSAELVGDQVCFSIAGLELCAAKSSLTHQEAVECEDVWGGLTGAEVGEAYGVGGLGLVGTGRGGSDGGGSGSIGFGAGFGGSGKRVPRVRQAKATVSPGLDRDIIRRIVRAHINEVRSCYNAGLSKNPELEGRVEISFVIGATGKVTSSEVSQHTLEGGDDVATCVAKAVKRWKFPKPRGGSEVEVVYPFNLSPG